jgi:hypothetical protein
MTIRFLPNGDFEFETVADALAWRDRLIGPDPGPAPRDLAALVRHSNPTGLCVLIALLGAHPSPLTTRELAARCGLEPCRLGPAIKSIYRRSARLGFSRGELVKVQRHDVSGRRRSLFLLADDHAIQLRSMLTNASR